MKISFSSFALIYSKCLYFTISIYIGTVERKKIIETIRRTGNYLHNTNASLNTGELIVCRRPQTTKHRTAKDFICCSNCKGFFTKNNLRHHSAACKGKSKRRGVLILGRTVCSRIHQIASDTLRKMIFPVMRDDSIVRLIRYDELLIKYGNKMCLTYKLQHQHDMIRARLRLLGRFLFTIKEIDSNIENFTTIYNPKYYDKCIEAVKKVAKFVPETGRFEVPTVAANLKTYLTKVGRLLVTESIKKNDNQQKQLTEDFLKILVEDYGTRINKVVEETVTQRNREKKIELPLDEDIQKLHAYLTAKRTKAYEDLKCFTYKTWLTLVETTVISVQLFNRRRAGEIEKTTITDFERHQGISEETHSDIYNALSSNSKQLAENYVRFVIRGKLNRTVPVLLHQDLLKCIQKILQCRHFAGVPSTNPFVFGLPGYSHKRYKHIKACDVLRKLSYECGATKPHTLRGTAFRKHIATKCILLNLNEDDVTDLANFMGHDKEIHKKHYRQPIPEMDILQMGALLEALQGNVDEDNDSTSEDDTSDEEVTLAEQRSEEQSKKRNKYQTRSIPASRKRVRNTFDLEKSNDSAESVDNSAGQCSDVNTQSLKKKGLKRSTSPYGRVKRIRWNKEEQETVLQEFQSFLVKSKLPSGNAIAELKMKKPCLSNRSVPQIKTYLHNIMTGKIKKTFIKTIAV